MGNSIQVDNTKFLRKMKKYEEIVGKEVAQLVQNAARLCAIECLKNTAPKGNSNASKKAGENKMQSDIRGIFTIVNPFWWKKIEKGTAFQSGGAAIHDKSGIIWATDAQSQITDINFAKSWHQEHRTQSGSTTRLGLLDRAIVKKSVYKNYLRQAISKVGISKAGWAIVAGKCNADVREPLKGIPSWVQRHIDKASGDIAELKKDGFGFSISLTNKVNYARATLDSMGESFAVNLAKKKMLSMMNHAIRYEKAKLAEFQQ